MVFVSFRIDGVVDQSVENIGHGNGILGFIKGVGVRHFYTDNDVGTHFLDYVGGEVVHQSAIDKQMLAHGDGREHAWYGHAGPHRGRDASMPDDDFLARPDVGGYTGKGDGQVVEIHFFLIAYTQVVEQVDQSGVVDIRTGDEADGFVF